MIEIKGLSKRFSGYDALVDVDLNIRDGELVALLGPSGSGKTTLLRIIAGLETADRGAIRFGGEDAGRLGARERRVGFVFQHYALFRHMTVFDNVAFGLTVRPRASRPGRAEIAERVSSLLRMVQLESLADRFPNQLSGGQRQRVALARALAIEPRVLLLDEPFGALDAKVRKELRRWLRRLHDDLGLTGVFVTHDQEEALEVADRVVVMSQGRIEQIGTPAEVYDRPATAFVYQFFGNVNKLPVMVEAGRLKVAGVSGAGTAGLPLPAGLEATRAEQGTLYVRPHDLAVLPAGAADALPATVRHLVAFGASVRIELDVPGLDLVEAELPREEADALGLANGRTVALRVKRGRLFFDDDTGWDVGLTESVAA
ncbi:sulfate/molybdate ABC transporter ATP-binding protein [Tistrella mobilis]|uniref:sulfate/molybdate ABC transporter ATP-binding protein n=1 Tax=Tistrella mobilis TaxID=171437 RepID=UPI003557C011